MGRGRPKKKPPVYTGQQYRGGRKQGRKNLVKTEGGFKNQHGVEFTHEEKKALEYAVNTANRKRAKMLKEAATLPRKIGGKATGDVVGTLQFMGKESDFILQPKTKSLQRFTSKEDYTRYMSNLERVNTPTYVDDRIRLYKRNFSNALENVYGAEETKDIRMKIRMMKPKDYMRLVESDETLEISYLPSDQKIQGRLNQIRNALGIPEKPEWIDEELYE